MGSKKAAAARRCLVRCRVADEPRPVRGDRSSVSRITWLPAAVVQSTERQALI